MVLTFRLTLVILMLGKGYRQNEGGYSNEKEGCSTTKW
ncbi:hypothetical protein 015DV002_90 [Bacillus phage 015DV002]|nr:hypothetical protein 015DV002_90 [Bacillus phage 015DV002]QQO41486.1 hypothetical protein 015DV004_107 [Bacillus phage 015DV004]